MWRILVGGLVCCLAEAPRAGRLREAAYQPPDEDAPHAPDEGPNLVWAASLPSILVSYSLTH